MNPPLRLGILSTARIARSLVAALQDCSTVRVTAVASRSHESAARFASEFGIGRAHGSYEALIEDPELDAIYNPLPNSLHALWSERALRAGKHVLCEKPLTVTLAEAVQLFATARECGRVLLEAYPYRYQPQTRLVQALLGAGAIGEVRAVQAWFSFNLTRECDIRLDPQLGGGALLDAGCYAVSLAQLAVSRRPESVFAQARLGPTGVDLGMTGSVRYEGGAVAQIGCAIDAAVHRSATIIGHTGVIETDFANHTRDPSRSFVRLRRGGGWDGTLEPQPFERGDGFRFETAHFAALVRGEVADPDIDTRLSLYNIATLEALATSARERREVRVAVADAPT